MKTLFLSIPLLIVVAATSACGGGGGGGSSEAAASVAIDSTPAIYKPDNYINSEVYDGSLQGTWVLIENSTLQFDLDDFSSLEGFFELQYYRRTLVYLYDDEYGVDAFYCMDGGLYTEDYGINLSADDVSFNVGAYTFNGTAVNNNHIEGSFTGVSDGADFLRSTVTLHKLESYDSGPWVDFGTLDFEPSSESFAVSCYEQVSLSGEDYIDGTLVPVSAELLFVDGYDDSFDLASFTAFEVDVDGEAASLVEVDTPLNYYLDDESVAITLQNNTVNSIKGTVSSASGTVTFDVNTH